MRWHRTWLALALTSGAIAQPITLDEKEYFTAPGFSFLLFHNNYMVGYQGGLQMIQQDERLLDSGDLYILAKPGQVVPTRRVLKREVDRSANTAVIYGSLEEWKTGYRLICRSDGSQIIVQLKLDQPLDWSRVQEAGFRIYAYPGAYLSRAFQGDTAGGVFPQQYTGEPVLLRNCRRIILAPEFPPYRVEISRADGFLELRDNRQQSPSPWFSIQAPLSPGSQQTQLEVRIKPTILPSWQRPPVIGISQAGYHPRQPKRAVLELDPRDELLEPVRLYRIGLNGFELVRHGRPEPWGKFHRYRYAIFDFTDVRQSGVYWIEYKGVRAGPFTIDERALEQAWRPTLQYFLPIQMCHVQVREGSRVWHGACHLDDAAQAPANTVHLDGYQQSARETRYADDEHIPGLNWGGWHDAGDHDIPAGSVCRTVQALALAWEEFRPELDETTLDRQAREVRLHVPDGVPDILQQIAYGIEWLLATYRAGGHIFAGVIERNRLGYTHLGDPVNVTDNRVYDPKLKPYEVQGNRSGTPDDRWAFTNRNTGLQYMAAQTLAMASRALRQHMPELSREALEAAEAIWEYEQNHPPIYAPNAYAPRDSGFRSQEIEATAELYLTTKKDRYRRHLLSLLPVLESIDGYRFGQGPGATLVRSMSQIDDARFRAVIERLARQWREVAAKLEASSPYGVPYPEAVTRPDYKLETRTGIHSGFVWGHGWTLQTAALNHYFFHKHLSSIFPPDPVFATVSFVLGTHPANNQSFVSGVGVFSPLIAYGFNRADWSHIPGGVISGTSLIKPDFMELKIFPFLWYQTEYVIHGAGSYIFDVLAAQHLAGRR